VVFWELLLRARPFEEVVAAVIAGGGGGGGELAEAVQVAMIDRWSRGGEGGLPLGPVFERALAASLGPVKVALALEVGLGQLLEGCLAPEVRKRLGQLQPFIAVFPEECMGQPASFGPT
jgi:hypothetical protein